MRNELVVAWQVALIPRASTATCAPPLVISTTASAGSLLPASTVSTAPTLRANSSLAGSMSTAMTFAPSAVAICTAESPMPPQPCTVTHSPARTSARWATPWKEVM